MVAVVRHDPLGYARIAGTAAIVTGASSGIGAATAATLAEQGLHVLLVGRDEERLREQETAIRQDGGAATVVQLDLNDPEAGARIRTALRAVGLRLSVLVHCAGVFPYASFEDAAVEDLDQAFAVHVRSPYLITQALLPDLGTDAAIVFVGSNLSSVGLRNTVAYSATKGAVEAMVRTLALELIDRGIRVNVVSPGTVLTPMTAAVASDPVWMAAERERVPAARLADPSEIAAAILYLASPMARFVVGESLVIDGGVHAG